MLVDEIGVRAWFDEYLSAFAALGRGESDEVGTLLGYYGAPLFLATDDAASALTTADEIVGFARRQVDGMRAANYSHSDTLSSKVVVLNATRALYNAEFMRRSRDGSEIGRLGVTYLITDQDVGRRMSALMLAASP